MARALIETAGPCSPSSVARAWSSAPSPSGVEVAWALTCTMSRFATSASAIRPMWPGTVLTPASAAMRLEVILSPIASMAEVGGPIDPGSEAHDLVMTLFGGMSKGERTRVKTRVRAAMSAQTATEGRFLGGRPPYGYRLVDAGPHPHPGPPLEREGAHLWIGQWPPCCA